MTTLEIDEIQRLVDKMCINFDFTCFYQISILDTCNFLPGHEEASGIYHQNQCNRKTTL